MTLRAPFIALAALAVAGCGASLPSLTTGSLFGGGAAATAAPPTIQNDPTARALQVGTTAARAQKCGFNFDPVKLRTQFLAAEGVANPTDAEKLGQIYDTAYRGVGKAVADQGEAYCSAQKTTKIKIALSRHLAGDYTPSPPEPVEEEAGFFGASTAPSGNVGTPDKPVFHPSQED